jgi:hypothetical protein
MKVDSSWVNCGKTVGQLIAELETLGDPMLEVVISIDDNVSTHPISMVLRSRGKCVLANCESPVANSVIVKT